MVLYKLAEAALLPYFYVQRRAKISTIQTATSQHTVNWTFILLR